MRQFSVSIISNNILDRNRIDIQEEDKEFKKFESQ